MERENNSQLDLFSPPARGGEFKASPGNPVLARIWNYEKTILILLAILVTGIVAFSLGVEKGRRAGIPQEITSAQAQAVVKKEEPPKQALAVIPAQRGVFTIQVASFKNKNSAQKEAEALKKKGFDASVLPRGSYLVLCVGNFPNKEAAQPLLLELNKRYGSCLIRRL